MEKDKLKKTDMKFFIIPFIILIAGFALLTYVTAKNRIEERYNTFETNTLNIADSYVHGITKSKEAHSVIAELFDKKIMVAGQSILLIEDREDPERFKAIAQKLEVDEIHLYTREGEVAYSTTEEYIGWKAYEGHPVYDFMVSGQRTLVEDIRPDSESGEYYKYGYVKDDTDHFVQIGVHAGNIENFLGDFEITKLINDISNRRDVKHVFFINEEYEIIASNLVKYISYTIESQEVQERIDNNDPDVHDVHKEEIDGDEIFSVFVPVIYENKKLGTLAITWATEEVNREIKEIILNGILIFFIVFFVVGGVLYYAYRKNKSNINNAYYDKLTGLPNSEYLMEYLEEVIKAPGKMKKAIILLNCTNFKVLNITYGFVYGNEILKELASQITKLLSPEDMFFRFEGDRFILVLDNYKDHEELKEWGHNLGSIFEKLFSGGSDPQNINAEIAIVEIKNKNTSVDKILQNATLALPELNGDLKYQIKFFNDEMKKEMLRQDQIAKVLRTVIEGKDTESFYLVFQPKLDINKNQIVGFEALARLYTKDLGQISPYEFIAIAEDRLQIYDLGNRILLQALKFGKRLNELGYYHVSVAVNISGIQLLREEFVESIRRNVALAGADMISLEFEITESVLLDNFDLINEKLEEIKKMGISISLDDFGTGFSSLSRLGELNIDSVKIDKYFIDEISHHDEKDLITSDIISMSHKIGLSVIAEGIEEEKQKEYLKKHRCDIIQGYLLSKPLSDVKAIDFLKNYNIKSFL